jgi:DNA-directed RNA polymerase specialized sigma24 family protein
MSRQSVNKWEFERAILALDVFERCAVLLTVFERLSIADAALLLNADAALVKKAQGRGLIELTRHIAQDRDRDSSYSIRQMGLRQLFAAVMNC